MRPLVVLAGGVVAVLGASALFDVHEADTEDGYRSNALGYLYGGGLTLCGVVLAAIGFLS